MRRWRLGVVFGALAAIPACRYDPRPREGAVQCSTDRKCPDGYVCSAVNNHCYTPANVAWALATGGAMTIDSGDVAASGGTVGRGGAGGSATLPDSRGEADADGVVANGGAIGVDGLVIPIAPDAPGGDGGAVDVALGTGGASDNGGSMGQSGGSMGQGGAAASGGVTGTGGNHPMDASPGADGATYDGPIGIDGATYSCGNAIVPASGVITDFSDWNATTATWGSGTLTGSIYAYADPKATMNTARVEGTPKGLHLTSTVPLQSYSGGGLTFFSCVSAASFSKIQFDVYGSGPNCEIDLQLQTFAQRPVDQSPPGGCKADGGAGCFAFPAMKNIVDLSTAVAAPGKTVSTTLASFTNWSTAAAGQIVGMQWQFLRNGNSDCMIDATFANIKFVP